ncbi:MAG: DUF4190 domain-containing protein [Desulfobacterales bacterium]|nr:DUF4190 domain-containing protein [Desulfobacterales bacterium]
MTNSAAVWSLFLGILSIPLPFFFSVPAVICGHIARHKIKSGSGGNKTALAGLITGYLGLMIMLLGNIMSDNFMFYYVYLFWRF